MFNIERDARPVRGGRALGRMPHSCTLPPPPPPVDDHRLDRRCSPPSAPLAVAEKSLGLRSLSLEPPPSLLPDQSVLSRLSTSFDGGVLAYPGRGAGETKMGREGGAEGMWSADSRRSSIGSQLESDRLEETLDQEGGESDLGRDMRLAGAAAGGGVEKAAGAGVVLSPGAAIERRAEPSAYVAEADEGLLGVDERSSPAAASRSSASAAAASSRSSVKNVGTALRFMTSVADQRRRDSRSDLTGLADEDGPTPSADEEETEAE
jgi:hypothetical protein